MSTKNTKKTEFDTVKKALESEIKKLEQDDLNLEESLNSYEKAISHSKELLTLLKRYESHYQTLKKESNELS
jgi:exodeoxyribonuclease VII small subunit